MSKLNELTISEAAKGLREGKFSSVDLTKACLEAIKEKNDQLNIFVLVNEEGALDQAEKVDEKFAAGEKLGLLAGIPCALKDIFYTKGMRTTCCAPILRDFVPPYDATVVRKLKEQDMVLLGKLNMDQFACGGSGEHSYFGPTKNPYDPERVAGGSSSGSAAALATGMAFYTLGTDTGGSIRLPASFCGVYGLKVTYGRVSRSGVNAMASSWDTVGPMGRSAEDLALVLQEIAGKDPHDSTTPEREVPDYSQYLGKEVKGLKIGLPKQYFGEGVAPEIESLVKNQVEKLKKMGAEIKEVDLPMTKYAVATYYVTMPAELSANLERFDGIRYGKKPEGEVEDMVDYYFKARGQGFGAEVKRRILIGTYVLSAGYYDAFYKKAQKVRTLIIKEFEKVFEEVDLLVAPVSPSTAFKIGEMVDDPLAMYMVDVLTIPASAAGLPGLSMPAGKSEAGLPVGLQIIAPQFEEGLCLQVASALEK